MSGSLPAPDRSSFDPHCAVTRTVGVVVVLSVVVLSISIDMETRRKVLSRLKPSYHPVAACRVQRFHGNDSSFPAVSFHELCPPRAAARMGARMGAPTARMGAAEQSESYKALAELSVHQPLQ